MAYSLKDFLVEIEDVNPEATLQRANEKRLVNLTTDIKRIMQNLDLMAEPSAEDARSYTVFDLYLALDTIKSVIENRLAGDPNEHKNDDKNNYARLWTSIEDEASDAVNTLFQFQSGGRTRYPRFVNDFNKLVLSKLVKALMTMDPEQARASVGNITNSAKNAVNNNRVQYSDITPKEAYHQLRQYAKSHAKVVGNRAGGSLSRLDRLKMIEDIAKRLQQTDIE